MSLCEWPEVAAAIKHKRCEIVLKDVDFSKRTPQFDEETIQDQLFSEGNPLNQVNIYSCGLNTLQSSIGRCKNLTILILRINNLTSIPDVIGELPLLKYVDVSCNQLTKLPASFSNLTTLEVLNVANNQIDDDGFFDFSQLSWLHILDMSHNKLKHVPPTLGNENLVKLHTVNFRNNEIVEVPESWEALYYTLKHIDFSHNKITENPRVFASFEHIKDLDLTDNPFKDNRFTKLVSGRLVQPRSILEYLRREVPVKKSNKKKRKQKGKTADEEPERDSEGEEVEPITVTAHVPVAYVKRDVSVATIRPYLTSCVLRNLDLVSGDNFRQFIKLQTRLHSSSLCENRTLAAIGTHDLQTVQMPLRYLALPADTLHITTMGKRVPMSGRQLLATLVTDAELARKREKRNTLNPLHRYLDLVKDLKSLPCLIDSTGLVMSTAPVTNSDMTKIKAETTSVFVEVSSSASLDICKVVMNEFVREVLKFSPGLCIDQVRVMTEKDDLLCVFPDSRDLPDVPVNKVKYDAPKEQVQEQQANGDVSSDVTTQMSRLGTAEA